MGAPGLAFETWDPLVKAHLFRPSLKGTAFRPYINYLKWDGRLEKQQKA